LQCLRKISETQDTCGGQVEKPPFGRYQRRTALSADVDKWALSSCLMCHFDGFGGANPPLPTISFICSNWCWGNDKLADGRYPIVVFCS